MGKFLPSPRMILWGLVFGILGAYAYQKSATIQKFLP